jgi:transposase-like protein
MLPAPRSPDGRTIRENSKSLVGYVGTKGIIPVTNAIEALNSKLRRAVRTRGHFPSDESAMKLLFLVLNLAEKEWRMPPRERAMAKAQFAILSPLREARLRS